MGDASIDREFQDSGKVGHQRMKQRNHDNSCFGTALARQEVQDHIGLLLYL